MIGDTFDPTTKVMAGKPYFIAHREFDRTYIVLRPKKK